MQGQLREAFNKVFKDAGVTPPVTEPNGKARLDFIPLLTHGGVAVIVGGKASNYPERLRRHPQFRCWLQVGDTAGIVPSNARIVINTRWQNHGHEGEVRRQARNRGIVCPPGHYDPAAINEAFERYVAFQDTRETLTAKPVEPQPAPAPVAPAPVAPAPAPVVVEEPPIAVSEAPAPEEETVVTLRGPRRNELAEFVVAHGDVRAPRWPEARRLLRDLNKQGIRSTVGSVAQTLWRWEHGIIGKPVTPDQTVVAEAPAAVPPVAPPAPTEAPAVTAARRSVKSQAQTLEEAVDEGHRYVAELRATADLLDELLGRVRQDLAKFREQQRKIMEVAQAAKEYLE